MYREADLYLLDDPLSAVDTHVGKHLFDECVCKLLEGKARILVTHQVQYLSEVSRIAILNNVSPPKGACGAGNAASTDARRDGPTGKGSADAAMPLRTAATPRGAIAQIRRQ